MGDPEEIRCASCGELAMIRLTETGGHDDEVTVRVEGDLDAQGLQVVTQAVGRYARRGVGTVVLEADGVVSVDTRALRHWTGVDGAALVVRTSRPFLREQLDGAGLCLAPDDGVPPRHP